MTRRARLHMRVSFIVIAIALLSSSCGIPLNASAKPISAAQTGLLSGTPQTPSTSPKPGSTPFTVYFLRDGSLYAVRRYLNSSTLSTTALATAALAALNVGPSANEISQGITTSLLEVPRANLRLSAINLEHHLAEVILDSEFIPPNLFGTRLAQAYAQIVFTLTSSVFAKQISAVQFMMNANLWPAYLPNGSFGDVANQHDYADFSPFPVASSAKKASSHNLTPTSSSAPPPLGH